MPVRFMNLVEPLGASSTSTPVLTANPTARRTTDTTARHTSATRSGAVTPLIGASLRQGDVDSSTLRSTRATTPGARTSSTATATPTTRTTSSALAPSADSCPREGQPCPPTTTKSNRMRPSGCATSSTRATSPLASLTPGASKMLTPATYANSRSAISSPASAFGLTPYVLPDGAMTDLFGPVPVLANLSPRQARELGLMTSGTCGRTSTTSSRSASLQSSLESRFRENVQVHGSTLFKLTWKPWATPSGRSRSRLVASALTTSANARTGVPTPTSTIVDEKPRPPITRGRKPSDPQIGLADIAVHLLGPAQVTTGSCAPMAGKGRLNPAYPCWLMSIPAAWISCAPSAMPSTRKPRKPSSKQ